MNITATATWESERLLLRLLGPEWAAEARAYSLRARDYQEPYDPIRPPDFFELPAVAERLSAQIAEADQGRSLCLFISLKNDPDRIIGTVNVRNIIRGAMQGCTVGYGLEPDAVGQGYMTEALNRVVDICFHDLGLHRVEVNIMPRNARSLAVAERAGFVREGISPRYLRIAGRWEDHVRLGRVARDPEE